MPWNDGLVNAFPNPLDKLTTNPRLNQIDDNAFTLTRPALGRLPFPFFDLPPELRNRIYFLILFSEPRYPNMDTSKRKCRISVLLANKKSHAEAAYMLYTTINFRIFPLQDFSRVPSIRELPSRYRMFVTNLELVLGSSWTDPPKTWRVTKFLAKRLSALEVLQTLKIFVQADPSQPAFAKYRKSYSFYTDFCGELLEALLKVMPQVKFIVFDGYPSVDLGGPLVTRLRAVAEDSHKLVKQDMSN